MSEIVNRSDVPLKEPIAGSRQNVKKGNSYKRNREPDGKTVRVSIVDCQATQFIHELDEIENH